MPLTQAQIQAAQTVQHAAAHDQTQQVRVVAGPGTGKSSAIEERVRWLLAQGVQAAAIFAVSFTRASALDLRQHIHAYCSQNGPLTAVQVRVTTLHSLALRTLRAAGLLTAYPADPLVPDTWELENVFDAEFGHTSGIGKERREKIRLEHEAFWSTGQWGAPNYVPPNPPISAAELSQFSAFHGPRTQSYSCVLPGEIVRQCVAHMGAGTLNAVGLLNLEHLVVDEFQDLNPMDLQTDEQQAALLQAVLDRLNLPLPAVGVLPPRVRVMTMHGAKGLSGKVVFIPGLEEEILPGPWRQPYPGLVLEAAGLLYVSITRARAACIISYARTRVVHGQFGSHTPSRFAVHLGGPFLARTASLSSAEVQRIVNEVSHL